MKFTAALLALGAALVAAQDSNQSICDKYTIAALKNNTSANQLTLLTLLVNTAVIGSYSDAANKSVQVPGILADGMVDGTPVSLAKYFNGSLASSNMDEKPTAINWLDGGGAAPLKMNMPAFQNASNSNQAMLLNHLYQIFGVLLGCSMQGSGMAFDSYQGDTSMSNVHRFMNLNKAETTYFVQQVGASAQSFGVSSDDINTAATALMDTFNYRCAPAAALAKGATPASQSICVASDCPLANNSDCNADVKTNSYPNGTSDVTASAANSSNTNTGTAGGSSGGQSTGHDGALRTAMDTAVAVFLAGGAVAAAALI